MNTPQRSKGKTFITKARRLMAANDLDGAELAVKQAVVALDRATKSGAIHANNAARRKSRIMKQLHQAKSS
jgi:small subunit ribosomal protein S20